MANTRTALLRRAEDALARALRDPCGPDDLAELVTSARRAGAAEALVVALRARAWCARSRLADQEAKSDLDEAVRQARRSGLTSRLAEVLTTRAAVNHELGRTDAAQRDLDSARAAGPCAELDLQQAVLYQNTGRLTDASLLYRGILRRERDALVRGKVSNNLALIESQQGDFASALSRLDRLLADADGLGPALTAAVVDSRAWVLVQSGRLVEGLRALTRAAEAHERAGLPLGEHHLEHADALLELRLLPEARSMTVLALQDFERQGVLLLAAEARLRAARLALLTGDPHEAAAHASTAGELFRRQRRTTWAALAQVVRVEALDRTGRSEQADTVRLLKAGRLLEGSGLCSWAADAYLAAGRRELRAGRRTGLDHLDRASELCAQGPALVRVKGRVAAATAAGARASRREVLGHCRAGLADLERHRDALPSAELRALASGHGAELGRLALASLLPDARPGQVLQWLERTRAAAFLLSEPPHTEGIETDLAQLRTTQEELAEARRRGEEPPAVLARQKLLEARIRRSTWTQQQADRVTERSTLQIGELRRALDGRVLVEYGEHEGRLLAVTVGARRSALQPLAELAEVQEQGRRLHFGLRRLAQPALPAVHAAVAATTRAAHQRLVAALVEPLGLAPDEPVVVVPTAATWALPWTALYRRPVSLAPSAATWLRTTGPLAGPAQTGVVLVAGPDLPGAVEEVTALQALHPGSTVLTAPRCTVPAVRSALGSAELAHLACHGRLRADNPVFSSLLLCSGELTLHELNAEQQAPHRVVLSACESGGGSDYAGGELLGFVSALLAHGTAGLLASCVPVPDFEAVPLMCALHGRLSRGDTLHEALHAATDVLDPDQPAELVTSYAFNAYGAA